MLIVAKSDNRTTRAALLQEKAGQPFNIMKDLIIGVDTIWCAQSLTLTINRGDILKTHSKIVMAMFHERAIFFKNGLLSVAVPNKRSPTSGALPSVAKTDCKRKISLSFLKMILFS